MTKIRIIHRERIKVNNDFLSKNYMLECFIILFMKTKLALENYNRFLIIYNKYMTKS